MNQFLETFNGVVVNNRSILETNQVISFVGWWYDSAVLKLQKRDGHHQH